MTPLDKMTVVAVLCEIHRRDSDPDEGTYGHPVEAITEDLVRQACLKQTDVNKNEIIKAVKRRVPSHMRSRLV